MPSGPVSGVLDPDSRSFDDDIGFGVALRRDVKAIAQQVVCVEAFVDVHCPAKQAGALSSPFDILHRFDRSQQHGGRMTFALGYHIHAVVHSVDQINVGVSRWTEHDFCATGQALGGMCGEIVRSEICLHFYNPADPLPAVRKVNKEFPEQFPGDHNCISIIE